jgi:hypothetical protein
MRTKSGVHISGGPGFWLLAGWFIVPLWLMGQLLKGAILLAVWIGRETTAHRQRKHTPAATMAATAAADANAEPEDAVPDLAQPAPPTAPPPQNHRVLIAVTAAACAALLALAAVSAARFR